MGRFIVRFSAQGVPADVVARVRAAPYLKLIEVTDRMLYVEGAEADVKRIAPEGTRVFPDEPGRTDYQLPTTIPKISKK